MFSFIDALAITNYTREESELLYLLHERWGDSLVRTIVDPEELMSVIT